MNNEIAPENLPQPNDKPSRFKALGNCIRAVVEALATEPEPWAYYHVSSGAAPVPGGPEQSLDEVYAALDQIK
jgi:hypothetical protein